MLTGLTVMFKLSGCIPAGLKSAASQPTSVSEAMSGKCLPCSSKLKQQRCIDQGVCEAFSSCLMLQCTTQRLMHIVTPHNA